MAFGGSKRVLATQLGLTVFFGIFDLVPQTVDYRFLCGGLANNSGTVDMLAQQLTKKTLKSDILSFTQVTHARHVSGLFFL